MASFRYSSSTPSRASNRLVKTFMGAYLSPTG
jgi:hypothetical protein